jgi:hypothetical protein
MNGAVYQACGRVTADALRDGARGATGGKRRPRRLVQSDDALYVDMITKLCEQLNKLDILLVSL